VYETVFTAADIFIDVNILTLIDELSYRLLQVIHCVVLFVRIILKYMH